VKDWQAKPRIFSEFQIEIFSSPSFRGYSTFFKLTLQGWRNSESARGHETWKYGKSKFELVKGNR